MPVETVERDAQSVTQGDTPFFRWLFASVSRFGARSFRSRIVYHPRYERFLRRTGVVSAETALSLRGEIVCGHPDRHVARVMLGEGAAQRVVYLKREHLVGLQTRFRSRLAGFGWTSRSEREAITLKRLEAAGLPGPQWLAYGEDSTGRAFLIVDELAGMVDLRELLSARELSPRERRKLAEQAGQAVADLHRAGFSTPELAAKHLFVNPTSGLVSLVDWQSAGTPGPVPDADRIRQLAGLDASLASELATPRDRFRFARAYFRNHPKGKLSAFLQAVTEQASQLRNRSSSRDQRLPAAPRLVWLAGEEVCVIPELTDLWPTPAVYPPFYSESPTTSLPTGEEWITFADGRRALLTRHSTFDPPGRLIAAIRERPWRSPAATAARILFHLRRHGILAPNLLAFGQRLRSPMRADSFILTEPVTNAVPVAVRLAQLPSDRQTRRILLCRCGEMLRSLHQAGCRTVNACEPVLVATRNGRIAIENPSGIRLAKRMTANERATDLRRFLRVEVPGLGRTDQARIVRGYLSDDWRDRANRRALRIRG